MPFLFSQEGGSGLRMVAVPQGGLVTKIGELVGKRSELLPQSLTIPQRRRLDRGMKAILLFLLCLLPAQLFSEAKKEGSELRGTVLQRMVWFHQAAGAQKEMARVRKFPEARRRIAPGTQFLHRRETRRRRPGMGSLS